ncbi:MAG: AAA family ATPase [Byssovorax sp.]
MKPGLVRAPEGRTTSMRILGQHEIVEPIDGGHEHILYQFPLGRHDDDGALHIPQKLYGRAAEERALLDAFERVSEGSAELLLVSGYSGIGKSVLVHEIHKSIARRGGYFIAGKFDQLNRRMTCSGPTPDHSSCCRSCWAMLGPAASWSWARTAITRWGRRIRSCSRERR